MKLGMESGLRIELVSSHMEELLAWMSSLRKKGWEEILKTQGDDYESIIQNWLFYVTQVIKAFPAHLIPCSRLTVFSCSSDINSLGAEFIHHISQTPTTVPGIQQVYVELN